MNQHKKYTSLPHPFILLLLTGSFMLMTSCKAIATKVLLGIDTTPERKTPAQINKDFDSYNIPEINRFVLDTAVYNNVVQQNTQQFVDNEEAAGSVIDSLYAAKIMTSLNDNLQPVQVRYFDAEGKPVFKLVNCYIEGIIHMDWNYEQSFDVYPPSTDDEFLNFGNEPIQFFLPMIKRLDGRKVDFDSLPRKEHYAIIFWNSMFNRPSRTLIKQIQEIEKNRPNSLVLFVNNHNAEVYEYIPSDQKTEYQAAIKALNTGE